MAQEITCKNADLKEKFETIKVRKEIRYFIMKIDDGNDVVVESTGAREDADFFENFVKELTIENECRYGLIDLDYVDESIGREVGKLVMVMWRPDGAKMMDRLKYNSGAQCLHMEFDGVVVPQCHEANFPEEVTLDILIEKARG